MRRKLVTVILCTLALAALAYHSWARTVAVVTGGPPAAAGGAGIDLTLEYATLAPDYRSTSTINKPTNTVDGDFLVAVLYLVETGDTPTPPSGWTLMASRVHTTAARGSVWIYYKRASSEGASWAWSNTYTVTSGIVKRITGVVSSGDPENVAESTADTDYALSAVSNASITTTSNGAAVCQAVGSHSTTVTFSAHTLTQRVNIDAVSDGGSLTLDCDTQATAGATGAKTVTPADYTYLTGVLFALTPQ